MPFSLLPNPLNYATECPLTPMAFVKEQKRSPESDIFFSEWWSAAFTMSSTPAFIYKEGASITQERNTDRRKLTRAGTQHKRPSHPSKVRGDQTDHFIRRERERPGTTRRNLERGPQGRPPRMRKLMRTPKDSHVTARKDIYRKSSPNRNQHSQLIDFGFCSDIGLFRAKSLLKWCRFMNQKYLDGK